jgi:hypothetical protein
MLNAVKYDVLIQFNKSVYTLLLNSFGYWLAFPILNNDICPLITRPYPA